MKAKIHPKYGPAEIRCACGNVIKTASTVEKMEVEVCSACHPAFTGKAKLVDTAGRIDKFRARMEKARTLKKLKAQRTQRALKKLKKQKTATTKTQKDTKTQKTATTKTQKSTKTQKDKKTRKKKTQRALKKQKTLKKKVGKK